MNPILAKRKELGLTQQQVARLLGTKQSNISAYEKANLTPGSVVEQRFAALLALEFDSAYCRNGISTIASSAAELKAYMQLAVRKPNPKGPIEQRLDLEVDMIRFMIDLSDQFVHVKNPVDQALFLAQPATTGDRDVDALYAGMAVHLTRTSQLDRVPAWVRRHTRANAGAWFPGIPSDTPLLRRDAIVNGIPALRARAIFISRQNLESV